MLLRAVGALPRPMARSLCTALAQIVLASLPKLSRTAHTNLRLAFPEMSYDKREEVLDGLCVSIGWMLAEFCRFPQYTRENVAEICVHEGLENYLAAQKLGRGVLVLTGHVGGWEIGSFAHSVYGYPMDIVVRDIDNEEVDALARRYREMHGNRTVDMRSYARTFLRS